MTDVSVLRISEQDFYDQAEEHGRLTLGTLKYLVSDLEPLLELGGPLARLVPPGRVTADV